MAPNKQKAVETMAPNNIQELTPAEVDSLLVNAMGIISESENTVETMTDRIAHAESSIENYRPMLDYPTLKDSERTYWTKQLDKYETIITNARTEITMAEAMMVPARKIETACNAEFSRRGGWSRFWIVVNSNGHIHSSRSCTTCFPTTQYAWLPEISGSTDAEVVELAGMSACTICFPNAPVETRSRPSQIEEPARKAAREERERKAAEKAEKAAAKAIVNPDGTAIVLPGTFKTRVKTESEAQRIVVSNLESLIPDADGRYVIPNREYVEEMKAHNVTLLAALAHKRGTTVQAQDEKLTKLAAAKVKKAWG